MDEQTLDELENVARQLKVVHQGFWASRIDAILYRSTSNWREEHSDNEGIKITDKQRIELMQAQRIIEEVFKKIDFDYEEYVPLYTAMDSLRRAIT